MKSANEWKNGVLCWMDGAVLCISVSFTWDLPEARRIAEQRLLFCDRVEIGGPAVRLMPKFFDGIAGVVVGGECPGVLQMRNPRATRTSWGCKRRCGFCAVWRTEGAVAELAEWPDLPVICDNNLLATSAEHFDAVIDRLKRWGTADFNQGLDARLLTAYHARRIAEIGKPVVRLALDSMRNGDAWGAAVECLRSAGVPKRRIRSYALVGFDSDPGEAWQRCRWIEAYGIKPLPMWFHALDCLERNQVSEQQTALGWNDYERRRLMQWFYQHKEAVIS